MALKKKDEQAEEKKQEDMSQFTMEMIQNLQKEIEQLKAQKSSSSASDSEQIDSLRYIVNELKKKSDDDIYKGNNAYVDEQDIDPEDLLDDKDAVTFYCHKVGYAIVDDKRGGHAVRTPFRNVIEFKYDSTKRVSKGKETEIFNLSKYTSRSKKEAEWLKGHTLYGTVFFSDIKNTLSADAKKASKLAKYMVSLKNQGQHQIITGMKANGLPLMNDLDAMRTTLANHLAQKEVEREEQQNILRLRETKEEKEILQ